MRILHREWDDVLEGVAPPLLDLAELERLVTADELYQLEDDCTEHAGCRPIRLR